MHHEVPKKHCNWVKDLRCPSRSWYKAPTSWYNRWQLSHVISFCANGCTLCEVLVIPIFCSIRFSSFVGKKDSPYPPNILFATSPTHSPVPPNCLGRRPKASAARCPKCAAAGSKGQPSQCFPRWEANDEQWDKWLDRKQPRGHLSAMNARLFL